MKNLKIKNERVNVSAYGNGISLEMAGMPGGQKKLSEVLGEARPLAFFPSLVAKIWGGSRLLDRSAKRLGKTTYEGLLDRLEICRAGESWELSALPELPSMLANTPLQGRMTLSELWENCSEDLSGGLSCAESSQMTGQPSAPDIFPWLIKLLDCRDWLSLQVHPPYSLSFGTAAVDAASQTEAVETGEADPANQESAVILRFPRKEISGKYEAWVVLDATPDAEIVYGPVHEAARQELADRVDDGDLTEDLVDAGLLARQELQTGQWIILPPGSVHTVRGAYLLEIQTPVDKTYRIDDYGRRDGDDLARPTHRTEAAQSIRQGTQIPSVSHNFLPVQSSGEGEQDFFSFPITPKLSPFEVRFQVVTDFGETLDLNQMTCLYALQGDLVINWGDSQSEQIPCGELRLLPACLESVQISPVKEMASILLIRTGD